MTTKESIVYDVDSSRARSVEVVIIIRAIPHHHAVHYAILEHIVDQLFAENVELGKLNMTILIVLVSNMREDLVAVEPLM